MQAKRQASKLEFFDSAVPHENSKCMDRRVLIAQVHRDNLDETFSQSLARLHPADAPPGAYPGVDYFDVNDFTARKAVQEAVNRSTASTAYHICGFALSRSCCSPLCRCSVVAVLRLVCFPALLFPGSPVLRHAVLTVSRLHGLPFRRITATLRRIRDRHEDASHNLRSRINT